MPYRAEKLFENLADNNPALRFFIYSPASQAIDLAGSAFPSLRPDPRLIDEAPMTQYQLPDDSIVLETQGGKAPIWPAFLLTLLGSLPFLTLWKWRLSDAQTTREKGVNS
jgi:hypothetical protein